MSRDPLYDDLAALWTRQDPPPTGMTERMVDAVASVSPEATPAAAGADATDGDLDLEYELLVLVAQHDELVGARGLGRTSMVLEFANRQVRVLVRVSGHRGSGHAAPKEQLRLDVWVTPGEGWEVTARQGEHKHEALARPPGRFEIAGLSRGLTRLCVRPASPGESALLETEPFVL